MRKRVYLEAYLTAIEHYALKFVYQLTDTVVTNAENKGVDFKRQYYEIGSLFKPKDDNTTSQDLVNIINGSLSEEIS
jgi:hypothetical protein